MLLLLRPCCCFVTEDVPRPRTDDVLRRVETFSDARGIRIDDDLRPDADPGNPDPPPCVLWRMREAAAVEDDDLEADAAGRDPRRESAK